MKSAEDRKALDGWLITTWLAVVSLGPLTLLVFVIGLPLLYHHLATICPSLCEDSRLTAGAATQWQRASLSLPLYATLQVGLALFLALVSFTMAGLLLWRRPKDRMAVFTALLFIGLGATYAEADEIVGQIAPWLLVVTEVVNQTSFGLFPILMLTLPDGRFVPGWSRWLALALFVVAMSTLSISRIPFPESVFFVFFPVWALAGPVAQIYRYRRISNPLQRQQIKWVAAGLSAGVVGFMLLVLLGVIFGISEGDNPFAKLVVNAGSHICMSLIPVSIGFGVLRYRLWDIDVIIRKTLVYSLLTTVLALVYFGSVTLLQGALSAVSGQRSAVATVLSTLAIATLFSPLRRRVQEWIDRRFYRRKYDAQQVLARFAVTARDETDLEALGGEIVRVVEDAMQPNRVSLWLILGQEEHKR
jgi:hypothetical protein